MTSHTMSPHDRSNLAGLALGALPCCFVALSLMWPQVTLAAPSWLPSDPSLWPLGSSTCPTSPARQPAEQLGLRQVPGGNWLAPGTKRVPTPADTTTLPRLGGQNAIYRSYDFTIPGKPGPVKGVLQAIVVETFAGTCDCYWQIEVAADSASDQGVREIRIEGFSHPDKRLLAGYRTDEIPTGVAPSWVTRSPGDGQTITFRFEPALGPGQSSRLMFLDTHYLATEPTGTVRLISTAGKSSKAELADVPVIPAP
jgi:hypothetical protein